MTRPVAVVGGGITGLAAALRLRARLGAERVILIEGDVRLGGKIRTERTDGFVIEAGPDSFLDTKPGGLALARELGVESRLLSTSPEHRESFIRKRGRLHPLPDGLSGLVPARISGLLTTPLLSPMGRVRAGLELLVPKRRDATDESIASFATRRFGREAYDWIIEPLLSGIYAGDGASMSLAATFPQLAVMEGRTRSLLLPMLLSRSRPAPATDGARSAGFVTFPNGMQELVDAAHSQLGGVNLLLGTTVTEIAHHPEGFTVTVANGDRIDTAAVVLATPAHTSARMVRNLDRRLADELAGIPFASSATVSLAFQQTDVPPTVRGRGFLSPRAEGGSVIACTCTSHKFPGRSPGGVTLFRTFFGRSGADDIVQSDDAALVAQACADLRATYGIVAAPFLSRTNRWPHGLPQYTLGHSDRLARIADRLASLTGLALAGNSYKGVGIPDCIASGWSAADSISNIPGMTR